MTDLLTLFSYDFFLHALITGILVSVCAALLGVSLVLKRYSMIGDGLSHVGFGASAVALAFSVAPLYVAIPAVLAAAFLLLKLGKSSSIKGDAATALVASSALAIGYTVAKLTGGGNVNIGSFMFGSIYTLSATDTLITVAVALVVLVLYVIFYNKLFSVAFDETFAKATGINTGFYTSLLACLTAVTVVIGMRMMGTLLISSLIIFPVLSSLKIAKSYKSVIIFATIISLVGFLGGLALSLIIQSSPGSSVVIVNLIIYLLCSAIKFIKKK